MLVMNLIGAIMRTDTNAKQEKKKLQRDTSSAVDHTRSPGVPPESNDDLKNPIDRVSAASFPASDPPSRW